MPSDFALPASPIGQGHCRPNRSPRSALWRLAASLGLLACSAGTLQAEPVLGAGTNPGGGAKPVIQDRLFGAWSLACPTQGGPCQLSQVVARDPQGKQVVLGVTVAMVSNGGAAAAKPRMEFRMSPDAVRQAGIGLKIGDGPEYRLPISACDQRVCSAIGVLDAPLRKALAGSPVAQVAFFMPPKQQLTVPLALTGLEEGLQTLEKSLR